MEKMSVWNIQYVFFILIVSVDVVHKSSQNPKVIMTNVVYAKRWVFKAKLNFPVYCWILTILYELHFETLNLDLKITVHQIETVIKIKYIMINPNAISFLYQK